MRRREEYGRLSETDRLEIGDRIRSEETHAEIAGAVGCSTKSIQRLLRRTDGLAWVGRRTARPRTKNARPHRRVRALRKRVRSGAGTAIPARQPERQMGMTSTIPSRMTAVQLVGHGGLDKLRYRGNVPTPTAGAGEVLLKVAAAGVNNTDINTRIGWYSKTGGGAIGDAAGADETDGSAAGWSGVPLAFPRIQGADCCGRIVAVGEGVDPKCLGDRAIVRTVLRSPVGYRPFECWTFGSECDGAFAQYAKAPACETHKVDCDWSNAELASIPCAYSTAENLLQRASVGAERVLVTGASGGVGSAAVQLAKRRGACVVAVAGSAKAATVRASEPTRSSTGTPTS